MTSDILRPVSVADAQLLPLRPPLAAKDRQSLPVEGQSSTAGPPDRRQERADVATVERAVSRVNDYVQNVQRDLRFNVDRESGKIIIKVIDSVTHEVIRQIPSEEVVALARRLRSLQGLILREQA